MPDFEDYSKYEYVEEDGTAMKDGELQVDFSDLLLACEGLNEELIPRAAASLSVLEYREDEDELHEIDVEILQYAFYRFHVSGGCAVIEACFPEHKENEFMKGANICERILKNDYAGETLSVLTIVPLDLDGAFVVTFMGLVHACRTEEEGLIKLVMCFDNTVTRVADNSGIQYSDITREADAEMERESRALDRERALVQDQIDEAQKDNEYGRQLLSQLELNADSFVDFVDSDESPSDEEGDPSDRRRRH